MMKRLSFCAIILFLITTAWGQPPAPPETEVTALDPNAPAVPVEEALPPGTILMNFSDASLQEVIKFFSEVTGKTFLQADKVQGTVSIINPQPIPEEDAFKVLESILEIKGFTLTPGPNMFKIVALADAKTRNIPTVGQVPIEEMGEEDRIVTQMFPLKYADANEMRGVLTGLMSQAHHMMVSPKMNTLIITEVESNLKRIAGIIESFDVSVSFEKMEIIYLKMAPAQEVSAILQGLYGAEGNRVTDVRGQGGSMPDGPRTPPGVPNRPPMPVTQPMQMFTTTTSQMKIVPVTRNNAIILLALPEVLEEIKKMIEKLDVEGFLSLKLKVLSLKFTDAEDMANELQKIFTGAGQQSQGMQITLTPVVRLNALVASSQSEEMLKRVEEVLKQLDIEASGSGVQIRVFYLQNAKAEDLAGTLESIFSESGSGSGKAKKSGGSSRGKDDRSEEDRDTGGSMMGGNDRSQDRETEKVKSAPAVSTSVSAASLTSPRGEIRIVSDEPTNSLIVSASAADFQYIEDLIKQLDVMPLQVLVKVLIAEVTLDNSMQYGIEWFLGQYNGENTATNEPLTTTTDGNFTDVFKNFSGWRSATGIGGSNTDDGDDDGGTDTSALPEALREVAGLVALTPAAGSLGAFSYLDTVNMIGMTAILNALASESKLDVLATPQILTTNNEEAEIMIGEEVPIVSSSQINVTGESSYDYYEYQEVGIKLTVTPRINKDKYVALEVEQEIKNVSEEVVEDKYPIITSRTASTSVFVKDQETIVIGGLISDSKAGSVAKVPILGDIPLLGWFFKKKSERKLKTELMVFITPYVMATPEEVAAVTRHAKSKAAKTDQKFDLDAVGLDAAMTRPDKEKVPWWRNKKTSE